MEKNYYDILGIDKNASSDDIKKVFRKEAMKCHPDTHPNDKKAEARFKEINEAYEVLSDDTKRKNYDAYGSAEGPTMGGDGFNPFGGFSSFFHGGFNPFGGFGGGHQRPQKGEDIHIRLKITLSEQIKGIKKTFKIARLVRCPDCHGSGGEGIETCPTCGGSGVSQTQRGNTIFRQTCHRCEGSGQIIKKVCPKCKGEKFIKSLEDITIEIPKGIKFGETLVRRGGGNESESKNVINGDLFITVEFDADSRFSLGQNGSDLYSKVKISLKQAILGGSITIPTIEGEDIKVKIPNGCQVGQSLRVKGKGLLINGSSRGDLYLIVDIEIPSVLSNSDKELLEKMSIKDYDKPTLNRV